MVTSTTFYAFPPDLIDPASKDKKWLLDVGRAISSYSGGGATAYGMMTKAQIVRLKNYANGRQDQTMYMDWFHKKDTEKTGGTVTVDGNQSRDIDLRGANYERKGYSNMDWEIWSPMPKIVESIATFVGQSDYRVQCEYVSLEAKRRKDKNKYMLWFGTRPEWIAAEKKMQEITGAPTTQHDFIPETTEEIAVMEKMGGNRLIEEIAVEDMTEHHFEISNWEDMRDKLLYELVAANTGVTWDYTDITTGAAKSMAIPLENLIYSYFNESTTNTPPFAGHYDYMTVQQLMPYLAAEGWSDDQIMKFAETLYSNQPDWIRGGRGWDWFAVKDPITLSWRFLDFRVQVLHFEYLSIDRNYHSEGGEDVKYESGEELSIQAQKTTSGSLERQSVVYNVDTHTLYDGCYVVTGDFLAYGGKQINQKSENAQNPMLSYHLWRIGSGASIVERTIPALNQLQRLLLKAQSFISSAVPPGIAIDIQFITGISKMSEWEIIARYKETGNLVYRIKPDMRQLLPNGQPFQELKGGLSEAYTGLVNAISDTLRWIYELSGVSEIFAGSPTSDQDGLGINRMQVQGTANAISKLSRGFVKLKEQTARGMAARALVNMRYDDRVESYYRAVLGDDKVDALKNMDTTMEAIGMYMVAGPQAEEKALLMDAATKAMAVGQDGAPLITYAELFRITNMVKNGDVKEAEAYLAIESARTIRRINREKNEAIAAQGQQLQGVEAAKAQFERERIAMETDGKLQQIRAEKMGDAVIEMIKLNKDLQNSQELLILQSILTPQEQQTATA